MCKLKHQFHFALLPSASGARQAGLILPGLLALVLTAAAMLQLAMPYAQDLPADSAAALPTRPTRIAPPPQVPLVSVPAMLSARSVFAPVSGASAAAAGPTDALNGAVIAGTVQRGRGLVAVVQERTGRIRYIGPGGLISGWRISGVSASGVRLTRGAETINAAYGAVPAAPAAPAPENSEEDQ